MNSRVKGFKNIGGLSIFSIICISIVIALGMYVILSGCDASRLDNASMGELTTNRIKVNRINTVDGYRGIYIITDTKTGKEYIGIDRMGIINTGL